MLAKMPRLSGFAGLFMAAVLVGFVPSVSRADVVAEASYIVPNTVHEPVRPEGNEEIMAAKRAHPDLGCMAYVYVRNTGDSAAALESMTWAGADISKVAGPPGYEVVWWRLRPSPLPPGAEGEVAVCLRNTPKAPVEVGLAMSGGTEVACTIPAEAPPFRLETVAFSEALDKAYVYVGALREDAAPPRRVFLGGVQLESEVVWLSDAFAAGVCIAVVTPSEPFEQGRAYTFRVATTNGGQAASTIRAFAKRAVFGTYGHREFERFADAGLNGYNSFGALGKEDLDGAAERAVQVAMIVGGNGPAEEVRGHDAVYAYLAMDEPDVKDYGAEKERPMHLRIGTTAQDLADWGQMCISADPATATMTTVDLTFTPRNYFIYGPISDMLNPDCYPVTVGWSLESIRDKASIAKRACAPKPFTFTYQGSWEEFAIPQDQWVSAARLREKGRDAFVDTSRVRGFGRAPVPAEVRMQMLYCIGCGARGLFSYTDASEAGGALMFHSSHDLPEIWQEIGRTSRALRMVAPLIEVAHPAAWAESGEDALWVNTLLTGERAALVVAVNEDFACDAEGFKVEPAKRAGLAFGDLPWFRPAMVYRVGDGELVPVPAKRRKNALHWREKSIADGEVYLVAEEEAVAQALAERAKTEKPVATAEGKALAPESYLKGRRFTFLPGEGAEEKK